MIYGAIDKKSEKYYTHLKKIFDAIGSKQKDYNWLITNHECYPERSDVARFFDKEYLWLSGEELTEFITEDDFQWVWGILSGFDKSVKLDEVLKQGLPCEDDYNRYFEKPLTLQYPLAHLEIVPFDSTFVMLLSKDKEIVEKFMNDFSYSLTLEDYLDTNIK